VAHVSQKAARGVTQTTRVPPKGAYVARGRSRPATPRRYGNQRSERKNVARRSADLDALLRQGESLVDSELVDSLDDTRGKVVGAELDGRRLVLLVRFPDARESRVVGTLHDDAEYTELSRVFGNDYVTLSEAATMSGRYHRPTKWPPPSRTDELTGTVTVTLELRVLSTLPADRRKHTVAVVAELLSDFVGAAFERVVEAHLPSAELSPDYETEHDSRSSARIVYKGTFTVPATQRARVVVQGLPGAVRDTLTQSGAQWREVLGTQAPVKGADFTLDFVFERRRSPRVKGIASLY